MRNYDNEDLLEMVELYAEETSLIASEEELSEKFDDEVMPYLLAAHGKPGVEFDDSVMICEEFSNWADQLCKEGVIHPEQYNNYCYVGKHLD